MKEEEITFEKLPKAVAYLIKEMTELRSLVESEKKIVPKDRKPIDINTASQLILKSKNTIYEYVRKGKIPCYKAGRKLYFYEDELLNWIGSYKKKTHGELMEEIHNEMTSKRSRFKRY
ncbi:helix-turn-helix domain-containing protein [Labilibaculum sp.]|uniref:helix-turn-helix domain-containing protein n=1 Tax=Labilibaculum sp. TaxID=2060723 RepID=UPI00356854F3